MDNDIEVAACHGDHAGNAHVVVKHLAGGGDIRAAAPGAAPVQENKTGSIDRK